MRKLLFAKSASLSNDCWYEYFIAIFHFPRILLDFREIVTSKQWNHKSLRVRSFPCEVSQDNQTRGKSEI